ncbi:hypothetical protein ACQKL6_14990 [Peribacillus sp. NPDC097197]|uniref:hypothetical protein n=1 Tax=Peribacillus sp. NPDC097197 TaxID=3390615 RepID=UPI003D00C5FA
MENRITEYALNNFVAPKLAQLTQKSAPEVISQVQQHQYWIPNFILTSMLRIKVSDENQKYVINILRRVSNAINEYESGRNMLESYLSVKRESISKYFLSVFHFENSITQTYQALMLLKTMSNIEKLFEKEDGSLLQRINNIYNHIKHLNERIENSKIPEGYTIPMWITNFGLESPNAEVNFEEFASCLIELGTCANKLSNPNLDLNR